MANKNKKQEGEAEEVIQIDAEAMAQAVQDIAAAMRQLDSSRVSRKMIVTLIHHQSKVPKKDIELVLNNLHQFEDIWLKPVRD